MYSGVMRVRLVLAVVAVSLLFNVPVDAQTELDRARDEVAAATERLESFLADLESTQQRGNELTGEYWQVESGLQKLGLDVVATEEAAAQLESDMSGLRDQVKVIALDQYMSQVDDLDVRSHENVADQAAAEALARLVVGADNEAIDQLMVLAADSDRLRSELEAQHEEQAIGLVEVEATQASITDELERLTRLRQAVGGELAELEIALAELEEAEAQRQADAAQQARIAEERERAQAAAAAAAELARQAPTPAPTSTPTPTASPTAEPTPEPEPEPTVPNPQPSEAQPSEPQPSEPQPSEPQPSESFPDAQSTPEPEPTVPNPQPSEPQPSEPQPSEPLPSTPLPTGGGIVCPLSGPFTHTDDFSAPRAVGGVHRANDLIAAQGTPVLAAASGTIEHRNSSVGGMSAHLKGDNGDYYFYTHLSRYENVGAGYVTAGTIIGYVGMTGNAPIPHLHFEIHSGGYGNYTNPYGPVRAACF